MRPLLVDQFNRPVLRASGGYEGAMMQRRLKAFVPSRQSINSLLSHAGENLVARSHYVVRNNPYARNAKRSFKANLLLVLDGATVRRRDHERGVDHRARGACFG
jgi:capsid protein